MSKFSKVDEKDFLVGYHQFTSRLRPQLIKQLCEQYRTADSFDEKQFCDILATEQLFLLYEALEGVFRAFKDRKNKPFIDSMAKSQDSEVIRKWVENKSEAEFLNEMDYKLEKLTPEQQEAIKARLVGIVGLWKQDNVVKLIKVLIPMFNKMKHKLMLYKKGDAVIFALEDKTEEQINSSLDKMGVGKPSDQPRADIDWMAFVAEMFEHAIQDLMALRLFELGLKPEELFPDK